MVESYKRYMLLYFEPGLDPDFDDFWTTNYKMANFEKTLRILTSCGQYMCLDGISCFHNHCIDMWPNHLCNEIDEFIPVQAPFLDLGDFPAVKPLQATPVSETSQAFDAGLAMA